MSSRFRWLLVFVICIVARPAISQEPARALVQKFERTYRQSTTLKASFFERYAEGGKEVRAEAGVAYFKKPGKMRWEYESPERNLFLIDGKWSWFYVPTDHTATRIRAKDSSDWRTPLALLAGEVRVSKICKQVMLDTSAKPTDPKGVVLKCQLRGATPAPSAGSGLNPTESSSDWVTFEIHSQTGELLRIEASEPGGVRIEYRFANWQFDPSFDPSKFQFSPPRGVAIVDGDLGVQRETSASASH